MGAFSLAAVSALILMRLARPDLLPDRATTTHYGAAQDTTMHSHASGTFEVKLTPQAPEEHPAGAAIGRMILDKQFHGDLEATSHGQMLAAGTGIKTSAGYVALERVSGTLEGKSGTFVLQHSGTMNRGVPSLSITVVPDSGTGELAGLTGQMSILVEAGKHSYDFVYSIAAGS